MREKSKISRVFRLYLISALNGFIISLASCVLILAFNVADLRRLVSNSDVGVIAMVVFWVLNGIVFSGVQVAIALGHALRSGRPSDYGPDD